MPTSNPRISVTLSQESAASVRAAAAHLGQTVSEWIAETVNERLERENQENVIILPRGAMMKINNPRAAKPGSIPIFKNGDNLNDRNPVLEYEGQKIILEIEGDALFWFAYLKDLPTHRVGITDSEDYHDLQVDEAQLRVGLELIRLNRARKELL